jgi:glycosyltransferase involved in cell wall biosynthesis
MRVLLSAYACEPNRGSEQEVGWQRALHMCAFADEVWVITRANNQEAIEADPQSKTAGLNFIYYDLPGWAVRFKKNERWFLYIYCVLWQWGAYRVAAAHHRKLRFDCVYHVTFASMQFGSYMGRLGIPFVIGPVAGGERAPFSFRRGMTIRGKVSELLRDLGILIQSYSPLTRPAYAAATQIFVTTKDSLRLVPAKWRSKGSVQLAIGTHGDAIHNSESRAAKLPQFVFAGRLLHWKGIHLAIRALAEVRRTVPEATLTLMGEGPAESWLRDTARKHEVSEAVKFAGHVPRQQLIRSLGEYRALVFPSLHDSGGLVVLESFSNGVPVVCLDIGGPGIMVNQSCGIVVQTTHADEAQTVSALAKAMISVAQMTPAELEQLSRGAIARANELSWSALTARVARCVNVNSCF